jgi:lipopolysaccharide export system permease protein
VPLLKTLKRSLGLLPKPSLMDRYLMGELMMPFLFGVGAFSAVALAIGTLFDLVRRVTESGLPVFVALQVFLLQMPNFVVLAFPMATLLASLMVYSRLSASSEMIALRGCGVSIYRIVLPAILASLLTTGLTFALNDTIVPVANYQATTTLDRALQENPSTYQDSNIFYREFSDLRLSYLFFARRFDGEQMQDLTVLQFSEQGLEQIVAAAAAVWDETEKAWNFFDGTLYNVASNAYRNIISFQQQSLRLSRIPLDLARQNRRPEQMTIAQTRQRLELVSQSGDENQIRRLKVRIQQKYALPSICIVFALVGASLGVCSQRAAASRGFSISVIIIFGYYMLSFVSGALGDAGVLGPFLAAWLPTLCGVGAGGILLVRAAG